MLEEEQQGLDLAANNARGERVAAIANQLQISESKAQRILNAVGQLVEAYEGLEATANKTLLMKKLLAPTLKTVLETAVWIIICKELLGAWPDVIPEEFVKAAYGGIISLNALECLLKIAQKKVGDSEAYKLVEYGYENFLSTLRNTGFGVYVVYMGLGELILSITGEKYFYGEQATIAATSMNGLALLIAGQPLFNSLFNPLKINAAEEQNLYIILQELCEVFAIQRAQVQIKRKEVWHVIEDLEQLSKSLSACMADLERLNPAMTEEQKQAPHLKVSRLRAAIGNFKRDLEGRLYTGQWYGKLHDGFDYLTYYEAWYPLIIIFLSITSGRALDPKGAIGIWLGLTTSLLYLDQVWRLDGLHPSLKGMVPIAFTIDGAAVQFTVQKKSLENLRNSLESLVLPKKNRVSLNLVLFTVFCGGAIYEFLTKSVENVPQEYKGLNQNLFTSTLLMMALNSSFQVTYYFGSQAAQTAEAMASSTYTAVRPRVISAWQTTGSGISHAYTTVKNTLSSCNPLSYWSRARAADRQPLLVNAAPPQHASAEEVVQDLGRERRTCCIVQ